MTTFETIATREHTYGRNFIEVARKVARDGRRKEGDGTEFLMLSRGYMSDDGGRHYKTQFMMPYETEIVEFVRDALADVANAGPHDESK